MTYSERERSLKRLHDFAAKKIQETMYQIFVRITKVLVSFFRAHFSGLMMHFHFHVLHFPATPL